MDQSTFDQWDNRRMTGLTIDWHFEDENGDRVEIVPEKNYVTDNTNVYFIRLTNILYNGITFNSMDVGEMWENVKDYRLGWMEKEKTLPDCLLNDKILIGDDIIEDLLSSLENKIIMKEINQSQITESLLNSAAEMFMYLVNCPSEEILNKQKYYEDFFLNASPRTIVWTLLNINKLESSQVGKSQVGHTRVINKLIEKLDTILHFDIGKLDIAFLAKTGLLSKVDNVQFGRWRKDLQNCLHENRCVEVMNQMKSLGHLQSNQIDGKNNKF